MTLNQQRLTEKLNALSPRLAMIGAAVGAGTCVVVSTPISVVMVAAAGAAAVGWAIGYGVRHYAEGLEIQPHDNEK